MKVTIVFRIFSILVILANFGLSIWQTVDLHNTNFFTQKVYNATSSYQVANCNDNVIVNTTVSRTVEIPGVKAWYNWLYILIWTGPVECIAFLVLDMMREKDEHTRKSKKFQAGLTALECCMDLGLIIIMGITLGFCVGTEVNESNCCFEVLTYEGYVDLQNCIPLNSPTYITACSNTTETYFSVEDSYGQCSLTYEGLTYYDDGALTYGIGPPTNRDEIVAKLSSYIKYSIYQQLIDLAVPPFGFLISFC